MARLPVLVFDLMDTVIVDPFYREVPAYLQTTLDALLRVKHPTSWIEFECGLTDEIGFLERFYKEETGMVLADPEAFKQTFFSAWRFVDGMEALLAELKAADWRLWVLSNYSTWAYEARRRLALDRFFEGFCVSCDTGHRKPSREAYRAVMRLCGADHCLLVDDQPRNIAGAHEAGMDAVLFQDVPTLRKDLALRGVQTDL